MSLTFEPLLSPTAWVTLAIVAAGLCIWYALQRPVACPRIAWNGILLLTAIALAAVLIVLLNPIWLDPLPPPSGRPLLTILVDRSESMETEDCDDGSRFRFAATASNQIVNDLESIFDVRLMTFDEQVLPTSLDDLNDSSAQGAATDLQASIRESLVSDRPQGQAIMLVSDGVHNVGDDDQVLKVVEMAKSWDAPIYTLTLGGRANVQDLEVNVPRSQELAFVGQSVPITVEVNQRGSVTDRVSVELLADGEPIDQREVRIEPEGSATASFLITPPEIGHYQYQVKTTSYSTEATDANNSSTFQIRVVDDPVKSLVLEGKPYWDAKFLLRMLTSDPSLEVDCLVRLTTDRFMKRKLELSEINEQDTDESSAESESEDIESKLRFERTEDVDFVNDAASVLQDYTSLKDYQILVLGRETESYLTGDAIQNIRSWISHDGGCLICYRGEPVTESNQELARLLPVRWDHRARKSSNESRFRVQVTERGDDLSWLRIGGGDVLAKLPSLTTSNETKSTKPLAVVLGRGEQARDSAPVLTYQPYGTGRVVVVEGAGMWRWAFLPPDFREHDSVYATLWQSLLRWVVTSGGLLPGEEISLQLDRVSFTEGEPIAAVLLRREQADVDLLPTVELRDQSGNIVTSSQPIPVGDEPGMYQVFLGQFEPGHYEAELSDVPDEQHGSRSVQFDVLPDLREQLNVSARPELMKRISELSGGVTINADELSRLGEIIQQHIQQSREVQYRRIVAWDRWWVFSGILGIWCLTWIIRRRHGLI